jgi:glucose/arabinose dehydrogenase
MKLFSLKIFFLFIFIFGATSFSTDKKPAALPPLKLNLQLIAKDLTSPTGMASPKDGTHRLFITEQSGKIKIIKNGAVLPVPFLDLTGGLDVLDKNYSEKGLLGLVFHPDYKTNGRFFVYYSAPYNDKNFDHKSVLAEYKVSKNNPDVADIKEQVIMEIPEPEPNHNGGCLQFGKDGYLYIGVGDGGGEGDKHGLIGNGQNLNTWLGKILRIDVNSQKPYAVPKGNPFVGKAEAKPEIYAYGLRNPWRFSFDRTTNVLMCADVGQNKWEEVDIIEKGKNYGWRIMEGNHCYNPPSNCDIKGLTLPINEYGHDIGVSIIGGYIYRGKKYPSLQGDYIFGDWDRKLFYLKQDKDHRWSRGDIFINGNTSNDAGNHINSFGEDEDGEIYVMAQHGASPHSATGFVYRIGY